MGKSDKDAPKILGRGLGKDHTHLAVAPREPFFAMTSELAALSEWLAHKIPIWYARYDRPLESGIHK
jgi:hypothetical protein